MDLDLAPDAAALARGFAAWLAGRIRHHVQVSGRCAVALSGGSTPAAAFAMLAGMDVPWHAVHVLQVDERVAPDGDPARNATALRRDLLSHVPVPPAHVHLVPVGTLDAADAADAYAGVLRDVCDGRPDVVHLGLGDDGHTASWPPGDDAVLVSERDVAVTGPFNGRLRVTLTPRCVNRAGDIAFLVAGAGKRDVLHRLMAGDATLPAAAVRDEGVVVFADRTAI